MLTIGLIAAGGTVSQIALGLLFDSVTFSLGLLVGRLKYQKVESTDE